MKISYPEKEKNSLDGDPELVNSIAILPLLKRPLEAQPEF